MIQPVPHVSLEQWRALIAVVEAGGYAQAAEALHKSQSAVTYAVQKIESQLGVQAFEIQGRKAVLTATGRMLYRRALALVGEAGDLEQMARKLSAGWEAEIGLGGGNPLPPGAAAGLSGAFWRRGAADPGRGDRIRDGRNRRGLAQR
jgi:DNA-binding transcriptional LysR family regulator